MGMASKFKLEPSLLSLYSFVLCVAYVPGIIGAAVSTGWFILIGFMPIILCFYKIKVTEHHVIGLLFLLYASVSFLWTPEFKIALFYFIQFAALACVFCLGSSLNDLRPILKGLALGIGVSNVIALAQYYLKFDAIFTTGGNYAGLFINQDLLCEISAVLLVSLIVFKLWWWLPTVIPAIILIHSRAAILALGVCFWFWLFSKSKITALILAFVLICGVTIFLIYHPLDTSAVQRFNLWKDTIRGINFFGNGVGSYHTMYPHYAINVDISFERPRYAHNDLLQIVFEYGIGSCILVCWIWNILIIDCKERIILYAIGIISLFSYPFHVPVMAFMGCLVTGFIIRNYDTFCLPRFFRRSILFSRA